jgi:hypothetical protein
MYNFDIAIEQKSKKVFQMRILHIMAALLMVAYAFRGLSKVLQNSLPLYTAGPLALGIIIIALFRKEQLFQDNWNTILRIIEAAIISMGALHFFQNKLPFIGVAFALSALFILFTLNIEKQIINGYQIKISDNGVERNNGIQNIITPWQKIEKVIIKDDILTVEMIDNYLMQSKFTNQLLFAEEQEIIAFCEARITK